MAESGREQIRVAPKPADESIVTRTAVDDVVGRVLNDDAIHAHPPTGVEIVIAIAAKQTIRSEEHTSELQSLMRISYAVFCLKKKKTQLDSKKYIHIYESSDKKTNNIVSQVNL